MWRRSEPSQSEPGQKDDARRSVSSRTMDVHVTRSSEAFVGHKSAAGKEQGRQPNEFEDTARADDVGAELTRSRPRVT